MGDNVLDEYRERLAETPFDLDLWANALKEAQNRPVERVRDLYETMVSYFPTSGKFWKVYIEHEMRAKNSSQVEKLFQRCLISVLNMELWRLYVAYIKESKSHLPAYKEKLAQAYDFALEKIGMDYNSFPIWHEYVNFLKSVAAPGAYAENQKITAVRKVYQNGIVTPMVGIETLWKEYMAYEQGINKNLSEKIIIDRSKDYMNARRVAKEMEIITKGIAKGVPAVPPSGTSDEIKQTELWKKYIAWEKNNPLMTEDQALLTKRVMFAYEQCLLCLWHHPDIWFEAASFLDSASRILHEKGDAKAGLSLSREASRMFERAIQGPMSKNLLLYFTYADFEESRKNYEAAEGIYRRVLEIKKDDDEDERMPESEDRLLWATSAGDPTLAYVQCMRFTRRAEGIKAARAVFRRAREDDRVTHHVYVAAALMEYYGSKDATIAQRVFELGLKKFPADEGLVKAYMDFMIHLNDIDGIRQLFDKLFLEEGLPLQFRKDLAVERLEFEQKVGTIQDIDDAEKVLCDMIENLSTGGPPRKAELLVDRYRSHGLLPCPPVELKSIGYHGASAGTRQITDLTEAEAEAQTIPVPDVSEMRPFKIEYHWNARSHTVQNGIIDVPPVTAEFCRNLPPWHCFPPVAVDVEKLTQFLSGTIFHPVRKPLDTRKPGRSESGVEIGQHLFEVSSKAPWDWSAVLAKVSSRAVAGEKAREKDMARRRGFGGPKRRFPRPGMNEDSDDDDSSMNRPPETDVYRTRQQKRLMYQLR